MIINMARDMIRNIIRDTTWPEERPMIKYGFMIRDTVKDKARDIIGYILMVIVMVSHGHGH
jgi:preprotein translocase subunit SecE